MTQRRAVTCLTALLAVLCAVPAFADERKFTYSTEAKTVPEGGWEFEQWATHAWHVDQGHFWKTQIREELEYGITDRFNVSAYLNLEILHANGVPGLKDDTVFEFEGVSAEAKYKLTDPAADVVGLLGYLELSAGEEFEVEVKLVASKDIGRFTFAYNFIYEYEKEEDELTIAGPKHVTSNVIENTLGASVMVVEHWGVGAELVTRSVYDKDFDKVDRTGLFIGPNVHYASKSWWLTVTMLVRANDADLFEKYEARLILGVNF
jgi:hypothetical protein